MNTFFRLAFIGVALQLNACGGGSDGASSNNPNASISPVNAFESTLTTKLNTQNTATIPNKTGTDAQLVYSVRSKIVRNSADRYKTLVFDLSTNSSRQTLTVDLDPTTNQYDHMMIEVKPLNSTDPLDGQNFYCDRVASNISSWSLCNATVTYDAATGTANLRFNQSKIVDSGENSIILNGTLKGTLSIVPHTSTSIPTNASVNITQSSWHTSKDYQLNINSPITSVEYINNNQKLLGFDTWSVLIVNEKTVGGLSFEDMIIDPENAEIITRLLLLDYACHFDTCKNITLSTANTLQLNNAPLFWQRESRDYVNPEIRVSGTIRLY